MAYTVSNVSPVFDGQVRVRLAKITPDSAYAVSGGEALVAADFGLYAIQEVVILGNTGGYLWEYVDSTGKLKCYTAFSSSISTALSVEADARDFSATPIWVMVIGN